MLMQAICPGCGATFAPARRNQSYCGRECQKNAARGPRRITDSAEARRTHEYRKGRIKGLSDALYETPPAYRAEFMERLIAEARGSAELRKGVTNPAMLQSWTRDEGSGRLHIAHVLDHYCREVYGLRSFEALNPAHHLPPSADLAFPAEYFGPDAPPIYGDGSLKMRAALRMADGTMFPLRP
ncbi:hypothetical protein D2T31_09365 [Sinirhodobacter populi]|uniref:Uncharacterized protein n=1 Tax=Paenirhodobacter populi TaxID=2306993 RepID=A0A443KAD2_9RHOB|nr:hypothetical protein [Sinirhodobacter populi]RWR29642.1 hypothetical protein D2T31_09365 [Sinirhodobacter populi]